MKTLASLLLLAAAAFGLDVRNATTDALSRYRDPAGGVNYTTVLPIAREGEEVEEVKDATDAAVLFVEGVDRLAKGQYGTARVTFQTLISVYPESALVPLAKEALERSEVLEGESIRTVQEVRFHNIKHVSEQEILQRFQEREVGLELQAPFDPQDVQQAKDVLAEMLKERGMKNPRVEAKTRYLAARRVAVVFTVKGAR
jgi:TolA-binding protein